MILKKQKISGVYIIELDPYKDNRGTFKRHFCEEELKKNNIHFNIKQTNISFNIKDKTLRGFHFQKPPHQEDKIISCISGSIYNIVLDVRKNSETYLKWQSFNLDANNNFNLLVPKGCANAYLTLENNTSIFYYHSEFYKPNFGKSIRYNDPYFDFKWPSEPEIISEKDKLIKNFHPDDLDKL
tara:strand:- start:737 stop:1285 length:549 start_codon:yes stop_codon:yes gene_type:complete